MEQRVFTNELMHPTEYRYPLTTTLLTATTEGTAQTLGTIRADSLGEVMRLFVSNQTGSAATLTFYAIPDGGSIGASSREITARSIAANVNEDLTDLIAGLYTENTTFKAFSGTGSALIIGGHVRGRV